MIGLLPVLVPLTMLVIAAVVAYYSRRPKCPLCRYPLIVRGFSVRGDTVLPPQWVVKRTCPRCGFHEGKLS